MPTNEHLVLCGGAAVRDITSTRINLRLHGKSANVHLKIADIGKRLLANIPDVLIDLLEIASYIYAADSAISRGGRSRCTDGYALAEKASVHNPGPTAQPVVLRPCCVRLNGDTQFSFR